MLRHIRNTQFIIVFLYILSINSLSDSFINNSYNNHGVIGLINTPTARFYEEGVIGITAYDGTPDQKVTITSSPYDWLEASFFYTNIQGKPYPGFEYQDYKDKGFNFKLRLKEEGVFPAVAIGINDIAGTGLYSSEYVVASYGIDNLDMHFGIGWGNLNGSPNNFKNPLIYLYDGFKNRPNYFDDGNGTGGSFQPGRYFSDQSVSPFYGISYIFNDRLIFKLEHDPTLTSGLIDYESPKSNSSFSLEYGLNKNFTIGLARERDNFYSLKFTYKKDASQKTKSIKYKKAKKEKDEDEYQFFIKSLNENGIGVNKIVEKADSVGIEITQFSHPNLELIDTFINDAKKDSGIKKEIRTDYRIADLQAYSEYDEEYLKNSELIYERKRERKFSSNTRFQIRPFLAAREGFFRVALLLENDSEYIIKDNFFFSSNLKYSIKDNFDDLVLPPVDTFPAQVRSDVKDYLRNFNNRVIVGRAQFDYHITPKKNNHVMFTAGILEEMYAGYGLEYLYFDNTKNYAVGFELFDVKKRDYELRFGTLDYSNTTGFINLYYRNYNVIPFDAKMSFGEYLAGDIGTTIELSRTFKNGAKFGVFATFTDVSSKEFGEGSFDKGIFFNIPVVTNFATYTWRPLTKDPGAKLTRKHNLHDLLVRFRKHN